MLWYLYRDKLSLSLNQQTGSGTMTSGRGGRRLSASTEDDLHERPLVSNSYLSAPSKKRRKALGHAFVICVGGASGSGKTSISEIVREELRGSEYKVVTISADSYYIPIEEGEDPSQHNFDHPNAIEFSLLVKHLRALKVNEAAYCLELKTVILLGINFI